MMAKSIKSKQKTPARKYRKTCSDYTYLKDFEESINTSIEFSSSSNGFSSKMLVSQ